jgi:hypothetical protein
MPLSSLYYLDVYGGLSEPLKDRLHWQSFMQKCQRYCDAILPSFLALVTLGESSTNRNDPVCVIPPKVAKASKEGWHIVGVNMLNFANGNSALKIVVALALPPANCLACSEGVRS